MRAVDTAQHPSDSGATRARIDQDGHSPGHALSLPVSGQKAVLNGTALCPPLFHPKITTSAAKQQSRSGPGPSLHKRRPTTSPVGFCLALDGAVWAEGAFDRCAGVPFEWAQIGRERARTDGRASAGAGSNFIAGKKKEQGSRGGSYSVTVGIVCWSWNGLK